MMQYSPKLKKAMEEIKHILKRHDIGAIVILHDPPLHSEFLLKLDPSYSCIKQNVDEIRIRSKVADYGGDRKKQADHLTDTVNMVIHFSKVTKNVDGMLNGLILKLKESMEIDERDEGMTGHATQNN